MKIDFSVKNTEEIGILTEKYICEFYKTPFVSFRNAGICVENEYIKSDIFNVLTKLNLNILHHTGHKNEYHDFIESRGSTISIKTSFQNDKMCPQNIGQTNLKYFGCQTNNEFKQYFYTNFIELLNKYIQNLFVCNRTLFFSYKQGILFDINKTENEIRFSNLLKFDTTQNIESWKNSNTLKIQLEGKWVSFADIQIHTNRNSISFRFHFKKLLKLLELGLISGVKINKHSLQNQYNINVISPLIDFKLHPSIAYIGCKTKLIHIISKEMEKYMSKELNEIDSFLDCFAGTGIVSYYMLKKGIKNVISNDIQYYSYILNTFTSNDIDISKIESLIYNLNNIPNNPISEKDFIYNNYSNDRTYFTPENALKIDNIRRNIEILFQQKNINIKEYNLLIKLLLHAVNKVSNVASVYGAFLKKYKKTSLKTLELDNKLLSYIINNECNHIVYNSDVFDILDNIYTEIAYFDSPYNQRNYESNYHILETISRYDYPEIEGKTGLRKEKNSNAKAFCSKMTIKDSFDQLINKVNCKYLFISYNSESLLTKIEMETILKKYCFNVICIEIPYSKFTTTVKKDCVLEYLFCATKTKKS